MVRWLVCPINGVLLATWITSFASVAGADAPTGPTWRGRLFHTADERKELDARRTPRPVATAPSATTQAAAPPSATTSRTRTKPQEQVLSGYVTRSDGTQTVWINGEPRVVQSDSLALSLQPRDVGLPYKGE